MKKVSTILKVMLIITALIFILPGCTKTVDDIKVGVYVSAEGLANLTIGEDGTFVLNRNIATSYDPAGNYTIDGNKLVLYVNGVTDKDTIIFKINGDTLIFETGEIAEGLIKVGTEFAYEELSSKDILNHLENQKFAIQGENLNSKDDKTIISFGKAFVNLYNGAVAELEKISFKNYIENKNLLKFTDKILELTQKQELLGGHGIRYGLNNEFKQSKLQHIEYNLYYLELPFEFEGSGMTSRMLITNENGFLKLVDFYFGNKDGIDTLATGHHADRKINDPNLWENEEWINDVFDRLKEIEDTPNTSDKIDKNLVTVTAKEYGITHENYPKIDGSTSTLQLSRVINLIMYDSQINENYPTTASKTVPSYKRLINGEVDLILVPSASQDILNLAKISGVELEFIPVVAEALIFITPKENETNNITREQVRDIYLNNGIKNWSKLGGPDKEIVPISRNSDSGSQSQMDNLILDNEKIHPAIQKNFVVLNMEDLLYQVAFYHGGGLEGKPTDSYAIGYTLYTYLKNMGEITGIDDSLNILAFEGVVPSAETIADGSYSLTDGYYAVVRSDLPQDHSARKIIKWLKSEDGKANIRKLRLIPKD